MGTIRHYFHIFIFMKMLKGPLHIVTNGPIILYRVSDTKSSIFVVCLRS